MPFSRRAALVTLGLHASGLLGCSNFMVPAGSSTDGSTILAYNADSPSQVGALSHWPAAKHAADELRPVYGWDEGAYLGAIPQPAETYNVVGNTNEHQLTITETTFGGLQALDGSGGKAVCHEAYGCVDYGQLIWITLARARHAREAMQTMDELMQTYGYAASGESFSIADPHEVWLMEVIGKGNISKGSVWVATRIPDGHACAHANHARTTQFLPNAPDHFRHSDDVVDFARSLGRHAGPDETFSFSDAFDPLTPYGARTCEARVYSLFRHVAAPEERIDQYLDYVRGDNLSNRMPLYVKVAQPISVNDTFWLMRDHFEGTELDSQGDVGGGNFRSPTQLGAEGSVWTFHKKRYINERPIGVSFTHWNCVANQRPNHRYGVLWFGVDDSTFTLRAPFYGVASRVPAAWDDGNCTQRDWCREELGLPGTVRKFSFDSMHWVTNMVANYAYSRFDDIAPAVYERLRTVERRLLAQVAAQDAELRIANETQARLLAEDFSFRTAEGLHKEWLDFYGELFANHVDGYKTVDAPGTAFGFRKQGGGLRELIKAEIAFQTGGKYLLPGRARAGETNLAAVIDKRRLKAFGGLTGDLPDLDCEDAPGQPRSAAQRPLVVGVALVASALLMGVVVFGSRSRDRQAPRSACNEPLLSDAAVSVV